MKLYTTHCPKCKVLETKLAQKNIKYEEIEDTTKLQELGIQEVPVLELDDGTMLSFVEANKYINNLEAI